MAPQETKAEGLEGKDMVMPGRRKTFRVHSNILLTVLKGRVMFQERILVSLCGGGGEPEPISVDRKRWLYFY